MAPGVGAMMVSRKEDSWLMRQQRRGLNAMPAFLGGGFPLLALGRGYSIGAGCGQMAGGQVSTDWRGVGMQEVG